MGKYTTALSHGITVIDTGYLRDNFAASHLVVENGKALLVDVGTSSAKDRLLEAVTEASLLPEDVLYILVTHIHLDHAGCAGQLMRAFPNARLVVHPKGARHMINPEKLIAGATAVYGEKIFADRYGTVLPVDEERVIEAVDGLVISLEGREFKFFDSPGHARHHYCVQDTKSEGVFTGDAFGLAYPELQQPGLAPFLICTTTPSAFEPDAMIATIERIMALEPQVLYLTHFGPVYPTTEMVERLLEMVRYHKQSGERHGDNLEAIVDELTNLFLRNYAENGGQLDSQEVTKFLAEDIQLNAQGIGVWAKRAAKSG